MTNARALRLGGLALIVSGVAGTAYTIASSTLMDGSAAFPVAVAFGVALLHSNRPRR